MPRRWRATYSPDASWVAAESKPRTRNRMVGFIANQGAITAGARAPEPFAGAWLRSGAVISSKGMPGDAGASRRRCGGGLPGGVSAGAAGNAAEGGTELDETLGGGAGVARHIGRQGGGAIGGGGGDGVAAEQHHDRNGHGRGRCVQLAMQPATEQSGGGQVSQLITGGEWLPEEVEGVQPAPACGGSEDCGCSSSCTFRTIMAS